MWVPEVRPICIRPLWHILWLCHKHLRWEYQFNPTPIKKGISILKARLLIAPISMIFLNEYIYYEHIHNTVFMPMAHSSFVSSSCLCLTYCVCSQFGWYLRCDSIVDSLKDPTLNIQHLDLACLLRHQQEVHF